MPPAARARPEDDALRTAVAEVRLEHARRINTLRLVGVGILLGLYGTLGGLLGIRAWQGNLGFVSAYFALTLLIFLGSRKSQRVARFATLSIALVDMPAVFFAQLATFPTSNTVTGVAGFTVGIYVFLVFLGALSLENWKIYLTAAVAAFWEGLLQHAAGVVPGAIVASVLLLGLAAATCAYASRWLAKLVGNIVRDVTVRERAEETLRKTEASFRALIEGSPDPIAVLRDRAFVYVNPALGRLLGFERPHELTGRGYLDFVVAEELGQATNRLVAASSGSRPARSEERLRRRDGTMFSLDSAALSVTFQGDPAVLLVGRDVTEKNLLAADLRRAEESARRSEKLAAVGQLAAGVAHDLRNPFGAVRNAFHWLRPRLAEADREPRFSKALDLMDKELRVCASILDELLDFARERPLSLQPVTIRSVVDDAERVVRIPANVALENDLPEGLPPICIDPGQFRQVLVNLIQNAAEAIPGDRGGLVRVRARKPGRDWLIVVEDDGIGIPDEQVEHIFEPLYTTRARGTGLGLAIVASIVKRHGGSIEVQSRSGHGTKFTVRVPDGTSRQA